MQIWMRLYKSKSKVTSFKTSTYSSLVFSIPFVRCILYYSFVCVYVIVLCVQWSVPNKLPLVGLMKLFVCIKFSNLLKIFFRKVTWKERKNVYMTKTSISHRKISTVFMHHIFYILAYIFMILLMYFIFYCLCIFLTDVLLVEFPLYTCVP